MAYEVTNHNVVRRFQVQIERDDNETEDKRYQASGKGLSGCRVYASDKTKALRKIRQAIDTWLYLADHQLRDLDGIRDMIAMSVHD